MNVRPKTLGAACAVFVHASVLASAWASPARALTLDFPATARPTAQVQNPAGSYAVATGPWRASGMQTRTVEGAFDQTAYRIDAPDLSTLQIVAPIRDQLQADGFSLIYECDAAGCGGFDFRYGLAILPEPDMHVDMGDYRYLAAERSGPAGPEVVSLIASRSSNAGFVQVTRVGGALPPAQLSVSTMAPVRIAPPVASAPLAAPIAAPTVAPDNLGGRLESGGALALDDLNFASGAATLTTGEYASLAALADYLAAKPGHGIAIVGHTDASGSLDANISLSRRRAESVRRVLIDRYGANAAQVRAEGVGYLSPRATNLTDAGRAANRRVEVMLTATE